MDHQNIHIIKSNQQKHLILECLLQDPMNNHLKGKFDNCSVTRKQFIFG